MSTADDRSPAERYATSDAAASTRCSATSRPLRLPARRLPGRAPATRSRRAAASSSPRPPAPARRSSASSPSTWRSRPAASASTRRRSRRCPTRSTTTSSPATAPTQVGLLTGDNVVNGEAPIVVMTTEVLRNMLYAGSRTLLGLGFVVMDEVHYLADRIARRGLGGGDHPPARSRWRWSRCRRRSPTPRSSASGWRPCAATPTTIVEERRPVPLYQHVMVGKRLLDLFADLRRRRRGRLRQGGRPGQRRAAPDRPRRLGQHPACRTGARREGHARRPAAKDGRQVGNGRRVWIPSRVDVIDRLDREGLLPAIVFIFSRVGCDAAVTAVPAAPACG